MARIRRIPDDVLRQVFERLNRSGELDILVAHVEDIADQRHEQIQAGLAGELLTDAKQLAVFQARQGALSELKNLAVTYRELGRRKTLANEPGTVNGQAKRPGAVPRARI